METEKKLGFSTRQIHVGKRKNSAGALCDPIYQTSTFMFETVEQAAPDLPALRPDTYTPVPQTPPPTPLRRR